MTDQTALIVIDIQNDFCPGGALAVEGGHEIVAGINGLMTEFQTIVLTQDWHPSGHSSFASSHDGKDPFTETEMPYGAQMLWPDHCIQGSQGAAFHADLDADKAHMIVRKGFRPQIETFKELTIFRCTMIGVDGIGTDPNTGSVGHDHVGTAPEKPAQA